MKKESVLGNFWYFKQFSCGFHLRNKPRLYLATPTLDADF